MATSPAWRRGRSCRVRPSAQRLRAAELEDLVESAGGQVGRPAELDLELVRLRDAEFDHLHAAQRGQKAGRGLGDALVVAVLCGGAGGDQQRAAAFDERGELAGEGFVHHQHRGQHDELEPVKGVLRVDQAGGQVPLPEFAIGLARLVGGRGQAQRVGRMRLILVLLDEGGGLDVQDRAEDLSAEAVDLRAFLGKLAVAAARDVVVVEHAAPVLLAAEAAGAPAEVQHAVGPVRDGLPGPEPHLAGAGVALSPPFWPPAPACCSGTMNPPEARGISVRRSPSTRNPRGSCSRKRGRRRSPGSPVPW